MINNNTKLKERCLILTDILYSVNTIYYDISTSQDQKKFIETIIGAAIWYLPHNNKNWTGYISQKALDGLKSNPKFKVTNEHQFPRKLAAEELLNLSVKYPKNNLSIIDLYLSKYSLYNIVTPSENKIVSQFQRSDKFVCIEDAYKSANINLIKISLNELKQLKRNKKNDFK